MPSASRPIVLHDLEVSEKEIQALTVRLLSLCDEAGISLDSNQARQCIYHLLYVCQVNEYINLTRITNVFNALVLHIVDSLTLLSLIPDSASSCLDMGTGAGFPGIPLSIASSASWTLLDSVGKKVDAVNSFIERLSLDNVHVVHDRLETFALDKSHRFDCIVARAVAPIPILLEYARPLLNMGGSLVISKGAPDDEELDSGARVSRMLGYKLMYSSELNLPSDMGHRSLFQYLVCSPSSVKLPRQTGQAKKNPLA